MQRCCVGPRLSGPGHADRPTEQLAQSVVTQKLQREILGLKSEKYPQWGLWSSKEAGEIY